jgi:hypothetical protein
VEKQQGWEPWKDLHSCIRYNEEVRYPGKDHVVNDEVTAANEILRGAAPGKEASSWAK